MRVRYRTLELGLRTREFVADAYRFVGGLKGQINENWRWEGAVLYGEDNRVETSGGILNKSAFTNAINNGSFNPFARNTLANQIALQPALISTVRRGKTTMLGEDAQINGTVWEMPAGPLSLAAGGGNRRESIDDQPDSQTGTGNTIGATNFEPTRGNRDVQHAYVELGIPLLADAPGAHLLELNLAARVENYSDVETRPLKPKVSLRWQPIDDSLTLRGTWGQGFRAPSLSELHSGTSESFDTINDPSGLTPDEQVAVVSRGNSKLSPERSESFTVGVVYSPPQVKGLTLNVDYFRYNLDSVVQSGSQFLVNEQFRTGTRAQFYTNGLYSDPNAPLYVERDSTTGELLSIRTQTRNVAKIELKGLDFGLNYEYPTDAWGTFGFGLNAQYLLTFKQQDAPGGRWVDYLGDFSSVESNPQGFGSVVRLRGNGTVFWNFDRYSMAATAHYIDSYQDDKLSGVQRAISEYVTLDLQASIKLPYDTKLTVGVDNVIDVEPPFAAGAFADGYDRDTHSLQGRFVYASLKKRF